MFEGADENSWPEIGMYMNLFWSIHGGLSFVVGNKGKQKRNA